MGVVRLSGQLADGARWSVGGVMAENEGHAWRTAAQFVIDPGDRHEIVAGAGYGAADARLDPPDQTPRPDRATGAVFARDRWRVSDRVTATAAARYSYLGFLSQAHHADAVMELELRGAPGTVVRGSIATRSLAPGGDLLTLSTVASSPAVNWARLEEGLRPARMLRYEMGVERAIGSGRLEAQLFEERAEDVLLTSFEDGVAFVRNSGTADAEGLALTAGHRFGSIVSGSMTYTFGRGRRSPSGAGSSSNLEMAAFHDLVARLETAIDGTGTRVAAVYRVNMRGEEDLAAQQRPKTTRFDVQLTQGLPFLQPLTRADWELLFAVRNMFYDASQSDFLDELSVEQPPTRVVGGISVRF